MIKLTINHAKSHLPLRKAKGTPEQRIQKAIELNEQFFDNIKDFFQKGDVDTRTFARVLKRTANSPVLVEVMKNELTHGGKTMMSFNENAEQIGYTIMLPLNSFSQKISKMSTRIFQHETFHFFDRILNPKYNKREINLINNGYDCKAIGDFFNNLLYAKQDLKKQDLNTFLKGKNAKEKIDTLQTLRYYLKMELNAFKYTKKFQRKMEDYYKNTVTYKEKLFNYADYKFPEKIQMLEQKLAEIIRKERAKK